MKRVLTVVMVLAIAFVMACTSCSSCGNRDKNLGTDKNPVRVGFMPSPSPDIEEKDSEIVSKFLSTESGLSVDGDMSKNFVSIIDQLATKKLDVAFLNSLGYLLARDWAGAEAIFQAKGADGRKNYNSAIIVQDGSAIKSVKDLEGKKIAFTTPYSMAGYLMPLYMMQQAGVKPASTSFVGGYGDVIDMVYKGEADAGAIYYNEPDLYGRIRDARERYVHKYQDLVKKVTLLTISDPIPNSVVVFRKQLPEEVKPKLTMALKELNKNALAINALTELYGFTGLVSVDQAGYDNIREILKKLGKNAEEVVPGALTFYKKHIWDVVPEY